MTRDLRSEQREEGCQDAPRPLQVTCIETLDGLGDRAAEAYRGLTAGVVWCTVAAFRCTRSVANCRSLLLLLPGALWRAVLFLPSKPPVDRSNRSGRASLIADLGHSSPVLDERKADRDRFTETVGSSSGPLLLLLDVRLVSSDDRNPLSPVRGELRNLLGRPRPDGGKLRDDLKRIVPSLFQSSADGDKSSPVRNESSQ